MQYQALVFLIKNVFAMKMINKNKKPFERKFPHIYEPLSKGGSVQRSPILTALFRKMIGHIVSSFSNENKEE